VGDGNLHGRAGEERQARRDAIDREEEAHRRTQDSLPTATPAGRSVSSPIE
jgi:hypothetical protein